MTQIIKVYLKIPHYFSTKPARRMDILNWIVSSAFVFCEIADVFIIITIFRSPTIFFGIQT